MLKNKILEKLLAIILIFTLTFTNFAFVSKAYASSIAEVIFGEKSETGHENIGFGFIGFETLLKVIYDERFKDIPKILETPYIPSKKYSDESYPPYKEEIEMIKSGIFDDNLKEKIVSNNE